MFKINAMLKEENEKAPEIFDFKKLPPGKTDYPTLIVNKQITGIVISFFDFFEDILKEKIKKKL